MCWPFLVTTKLPAYLCNMYRRVLIYGFAFGSLSAAMILINFLNRLYLERNWMSAIPTLANIIILGFGVFLFVKSLMQMQFEKPLTLGKTLFGTLLMALVAALFNIGTYQHVFSNEKEAFNGFRDMQVERIKTQINADSTLKAEATVKIDEAIQNLDQNLSIGTFSRIQIQMFLSVALVITLLVYVANKK